MPGQQMRWEYFYYRFLSGFKCALYRRKNVRRKLNAMALEFVDKCVLLVDDSIVRGTTSKEIIQMAKDVGAKKVIVASCAPPIRSDHYFIHIVCNIYVFDDSYPNVYGIDMPSRAELVAHDRDTKSIATAIGADLVIFQTLPDLVSSVRQFNPKLTTFDCSVFNGDYVTGGVDEAYANIYRRFASRQCQRKGDGELGCGRSQWQRRWYPPEWGTAQQGGFNWSQWSNERRG